MPSNLGEADEALVKARESLSMCEKLGDKEGQAPALLIIYRCLTMQGSTVEATETLAEAIEMYKEIGDKRSEAIALMEAVKPKLSGLKLPQLADCFFSRDIEDPSYKVSDAAKYRRGDEGMRMAKRASQLFGEIEEPGGADAVDAIIQDAIEKSIQAHIKEFQYIQEKIVLDADEKKPQKKVGVWLVQCPRMMSAAESDEDRARAILRIERDPPAGKPGKGKSAAKKKAAESSSDESDSDDDDADDEPKAAAAPKEDKVKVYKGPSLSDIKESVKQAALDMIGADSLASDDALMDAGLDSLGAVEFATMLQKAYAGITLPGTLMFDHPSVSSIAGLMDSELRTAAGFS
jgi:aryl carrier-like protein